MEPLDPLLTTEDLANYLKVDVVTIRRIVNRGDLPAYRIGGEYRFTRADVAEYLRRQRTQAAAEPEPEPEGGLRAVSDILRRIGGKLTITTQSSTESFKLTKRGRESLDAAHEQARALNHPVAVGAHLLLGLLKIQSGVAAGVLGDLGVTLARARQAVEATFGRGDEPLALGPELGSGIEMVIAAAAEEARRLGHSYVGTEHLLLAVLRSRDEQTRAVLEQLELTARSVRAKVLLVIEGPPE